jgi:hypothetical protein
MIFVCALKPALLRGSTPYFRSRYGASGQGYQALERYILCVVRNEVDNECLSYIHYLYHVVFLVSLVIMQNGRTL